MGAFLKKHYKIIIGIIFVLVMAALGYVLFKFIMSLMDAEKQQEFIDFINSLGVWGYLLLLLIQILQVVIAIIPGEPIEIIAGIMYGTFGGLALCLLGILIATVSIYYIVRKLGQKKLAIIYEKEENNKFAFLFKKENITYLVFILFLIPGTPKDVLTYICPFTKIKPITYFLIAVFARIPSVISSTMLGDNLMQHNIVTSIIIFAVTAVIGIVGITINKFFIKKHSEE